MTEKKVWTKEDILALLNDPDEAKARRALERAIVSIYEWQTADEKREGHTNTWNNVGYNGADSSKMSYYAKWIMSGRHLSDRFLEDAEVRIEKYAGQLARIANNTNGG